MSCTHIVDSYTVLYNDKSVGRYYVMSDGVKSYSADRYAPEELKEELNALGLDKDYKTKKHRKPFSELIDGSHRAPGIKRIVYKDGPLTLDRQPRETAESFSVYRRWVGKGDADYSPLRHDAPHREGPDTPEDMREWASRYAFTKMDDGTYQAELDEAWWWGGGHNDGGTIRRGIPEEWFSLPYGKFLDNVVTLAAAAHYGFTPELLMARDGLRAFFGYVEKEENNSK